MRLLIAIACMTGVASAATYTSAKSGNASDPTVWGLSAGTCVPGTNCPGPGDKVVLQGTNFFPTSNVHTVTWDYSTAIGSSGNAVSGPVLGLTITTPGTGYTGSCGLSFSGGLNAGSLSTNAAGTCTFSGGAVATVTLTLGGLGYTSAPTITVTCGGCTPGGAATITPIMFVGGTPTLEGTGNVAPGKLVIATGVELKVRGSIQCDANNGAAATAIVLNAGATLTFDSSVATPSSGLYPRYSFQPINASHQGCGIVANGTSGSHVTIRSLPGNLSGGNGNGVFTDAGFDYGGDVSLTYTDLVDMGGALSDMYDSVFRFGFNHFSPSTGMVFSRVTCTRCGTLISGTHDGTDYTFTVDDSWMVSSLNNTCFEFQMNTAATGGTRRLRHFAADCGYALISHTSRAQDLSVSDSYFGNSFGMASQGTPAAFSGNFIMYRAASGSIEPLGGYYGSATSSLLRNYVFDFDSVNSDLHMFTSPGASYGAGVGYQIAANVVDSHHVAYSGSVAPTQGFQFGNVHTGALRKIVAVGNILLANKDLTHGSILYDVTYGSHGSLQLVGLNNSVYVGNGPGAGIADSSGTAAVGMYVLRGGLYTASTVGSVTSPAQTIVDDSTTPASGHFTDVTSPSTSGANWKWNMTLAADGTTGYANSGNGYHAKFSSAPGTTIPDVNNVDPGQVAPWRSVVTADRDLWNVSAVADWNAAANGTTFTAGQVVSYTNAGCWYGRTVNEYVQVTHTKGTAGSEPCVGASTDTYWIPNSVNTLYQRNVAQTLAYDGGLQSWGDWPTEYLRKWVAEGQRPQNVIGRASSYDGPVVGWTGTLGQYPAGTCTASIAVQDAGDFGSGATATCQFDGGGRVINLTITNPGTTPYRSVTPAAINITSSGGAAIVAATLSVRVQPADIGAVAMWPPAFTGQ